MKSKSSIFILIAIFASFLMQGSTSILSPGIDSVAKAFPDVPLPTVMSISSLPALFVIFASLIAGRLAGDKIRYKTLVLIGLLIITIAGIMPAFLTNFTGVLICRALIGIGVGIIYAMAPALVLRLFEGNKQGHIMGFGQMFGTIGGMIMQFTVGLLAVLSWRYIFFIYLLAGLCFILVLVGLKEPEKIERSKADKGGILNLPFRVYSNAVVAALFMVLSFPLIISVSSIIDARQLGTSVQAGTALIIFNIGGIFLAASFGKIFQVFKKWTIVFDCVLTILAILIVSMATNIWMIYIGMLFFGSGLLLLPTLVMDSEQVITKEKVSFASGLMVAGMNVGVFLSSTFVALIFKIVGQTDVVAPLRFSIISLCILTILLALTRIKKNNKELSVQA